MVSRGAARYGTMAAWAACALLPFGAAAPSFAQPAAAQLPAGPPAQRISLADALVSALQRNRDILVATTTVEANKGNVEAASAVFDPRVNAGIEAGEDRLTLQRQNNASLVLQQLARNGIVYSGSLTGAGQEQLVPDALPGARAATALKVVFPLMRGRGEEVVTANERIQKQSLQSSHYALRETASQQIFSTTQAYWRLRAAEETLAVLREAEARAQRQVGDTERLIRGGEQPAANINLAQATLNSRRASRYEGERSMTEARLQLAELIGIDTPHAWPGGSAADPFPSEQGQPIGPALLEQLVIAAHRQRFSVKSAEANLEALRIAMLAAADNFKPQLNASVQAGFGGASRHRWPTEPLLRGEVGQRQVTAGLTYQWEVGGREAHGRYVTASANRDQQEVLIQGLRRSIAAGVEAAVAAYNNSLAQLAQSRQTVELFRRALEGERAKLRLNSATLLDVVNVENSLQQALTSHINSMASHAVAIAALRFQVGELVRDDEQVQLLPIGQLLRWTPPEAAR